MTPRSLSIVPGKWLLLLTALVSLVHFALLQGRPLSLGLSPALPLQTFTTRTIERSPAPATPAAAPVPRQKPAPAVNKKPPAAPNAPARDAVTVAQPSAASEATAETPPEPDMATSAPAEPEPPAAPARPPRDSVWVASSFAIPGSAHLQYKVETNKFPFSASADLRWQQNGKTYDAQLELRVFGQVRTQSSHGLVTPQGLAPVRFSDKFRNEVAAHFNREQGKVTFSANTPDVALLAGAQDRLSILLQLAAMVAGDPANFPPATTLSFQTVGPRSADTWLFTVGKEELLALPGGELSTLKLVRNPRQEFDQKVELWLAPALNYLPARLRITEPNGDFIDQQWQATEPQT
jgi:hypothetical protein